MSYLILYSPFNILRPHSTATPDPFSPYHGCLRLHPSYLLLTSTLLPTTPWYPLLTLLSVYSIEGTTQYQTKAFHATIWIIYFRRHLEDIDRY